MGNFDDTTDEINDNLKCKECGGTLKFAPGTVSIKCEYCSTENEIPVSEEEHSEALTEIDLNDFLSRGVEEGEQQTISVVKCGSCAAQTTLKPNVTSDDCPFCGTALVIKGGTQATILKPKGVLPFKIQKKQGNELFVNWLKSLWFAPNGLSKNAKTSERLKGMYIPYWTFDYDTYTRYSGQRGTHYQETENYTDSEGNQQSRTVTKTRWMPVSGSVSVAFDDVPVMASESLPRKYAEELEPWDLENLQGYNDRFLAGFQTETYSVDLKSGFTISKKMTDPQIQETVRRDIGGDAQRVGNTDTAYSKTTFKHILLPIWICAYLYGGKTYRFLINGSTGEVQGERPYSVIKITLLVLFILGVIGAFVYFNQ